jgi:hypothetical protein
VWQTKVEDTFLIFAGAFLERRNTWWQKERFLFRRHTVRVWRAKTNDTSPNRNKEKTTRRLLSHFKLALLFLLFSYQSLFLLYRD